jgi:CheY-like chemotaxis protein
MTGKTPPNIRIMVVDDEEVITFTLEAFLEDRGYEVFIANDGNKALDILESQPLDIAIVDIRLREYDGNTFILTAHELQPGLKFLIHTGSATYTIPPEMAALGISEEDIFLKPIRDFNTLFEAIERKAGEKAVDVPGPTGKIVIHIDPVLKAFVPGFLKTMDRYMVSIAGHLRQKDFAKIRGIAHRLKGEAGTYGFAEAGKLGGMIQAAAENKKANEIKRLVNRLSDYLKQVEIVD